MEYYIYVSDTKINMLYEQIPTRLRDKLATELKIDLKLFSTTFSEQPTDKTRFAKCKLVSDYIEKHKPVGTIDSPEMYFKGEINMRWGPYGFGDEQIVYFGGGTKHTVLGLGGSINHIIGNQGDSKIHSRSITPYLVAVLVKQLALQVPSSFPGKPNTLNSMEFDEYQRTGHYSSGHTAIEQKRDVRYYSQDERLTLDAVAYATVNMPGTTQKLKFLAKKLLFSGDYPNQDIWSRQSNSETLLGTPICVSMAE